MNSPLRTLVAVVRISAIVLLPIFLYETWLYVSIAWQRGAFPFDDNMWNDQTAILQLWRFAHGGALYNSTLKTDSFDYGPMYLWVLSAVQSTLRLPFSIVTFRFISMTIATLSLVPLMLYTLHLLGRARITRADPVPYWTAIVGTLLLGIGTLTRNVTFDGLHPDGLLFPLTMTMLLLYAYVASGKLSLLYLWLILGLAVVTTFTKLNSAAIFPILILGLALGKVVERRLALLLVGVYVPLTVALLLLMPHDMRAWTLSVPIAQPIEFARYGDLVRLLIEDKLYLGGSIVGGILGWVWLAKREGRSVYAIDGAALAAVAFTGAAAYLKRFGIWNNVTLIGFTFIPYAMLLFAWMTQPRSLARASNLLKVTTAVLVAAIVVGNVWPEGRPAPQSWDYQRMDAARYAAQEACARHESIFVTIFPSMFLNCSGAQYGLLISWGELYSAYPGYFVGATTLDQDPHTNLIVWLNYQHMPWPPHPWFGYYHLWRSVPVAFGYGWDTYSLDATMEIWERNKNT